MIDQSTKTDANTDATKHAAAPAADDSPWSREAYVFGGALKDAAVNAGHDPWSLAKVGAGAALGLGITLFESRLAPAKIALEAFGYSSVLAMMPSMVKGAGEAKEAWDSAWNGTGDLDAGRLKAQTLANGIIDAGLWSAGSVVSPAVRAFQLRPQWQAAGVIPWFEKPEVPPSLNMTEGFKEGIWNIGKLDTRIGTNSSARPIGTGSGFVIEGGDGLFVTAAHNLRGATEASVSFPLGKKYAVDLLAVDIRKDMALMRLVDDGSGVNFPGLTIREAQLKRGDAALSIGFPETSMPMSTLGYYKGPAWFWKHRETFSQKTRTGFSGGPQLDENGEATAMVVGGRKKVWEWLFERATGFSPGTENDTSHSLYAIGNKDLRAFVEKNRNNKGINMPMLELPMPTSL